MAASAAAGAGIEADPGDAEPVALDLGDGAGEAGTTAVVGFDIPPELASAVRTLADSREVAVETVVLTAFSVLMLRYTGRETFPLESPRLMVDLSGNPSFTGALRRFGSVRSTETAVPGVRLVFGKAGDGLRAALAHDPAVLAGPAALRLPGHLLGLLAGAAADPERAVWSLPLLTAAEVERFEAWNSTDTDVPWTATVPELIDRWAELIPGAVALVFEGETLDYQTLYERTNRLAQLLRERGLGRGARVGVLLERSFDFVIAGLAVLKAGAAYVPLDPDLPATRLAYVVEDCRPEVVLTASGTADLLPAGAAPLILLDTDAEDIARQPATPPEGAPSGGDVAFVIYTSGSTGRPKGTVNTHRGLLNRLLWHQDLYRAGPGDAVVMKTACGFDVAVWELCWPPMTGARTLIAEPGGHRDPRYLARLIEAGQGTVMHFVPSMLHTFLDTAELDRCRSLRQVICSGEALSPGLLRRYFASGLTAELDNLYGPAEAAIDVTRWHCTPDEDGARVPIGRPVANTTVRVLDRHGSQVPVGVRGELHLGGVQIGLGYHGRPELTAERFIPDPFGVPGGERPGARPGEARLYATGDVGRWREDGVLEYLGRADDQVKVRGFRIEPGEIEAVLAEQPEVGRAVVLLRPAEPELRLVAYVTLTVGAEDAPVAVKEVRARIAERLPEAMVPRHLVVVGAIPLSPNGKVDRAALLALPLPRDDGNGSGGSVPRAEYVAPRDEVEVVIARIFTELLGVERVGIRDGFFDLGGHSLSAARLVARLVRDFGVELSVRAVTVAPTVEALATALVEAALALPDA